MRGLKILALIVMLAIAGFIMFTQLNQSKTDLRIKDEFTTKVKAIEESYKKSLDETLKKAGQGISDTVDRYR